MLLSHSFNAIFSHKCNLFDKFDALNMKARVGEVSLRGVGARVASTLMLLDALLYIKKLTNKSSSGVTLLSEFTSSAWNKREM